MGEGHPGKIRESAGRVSGLPTPDPTLKVKESYVSYLGDSKTEALKMASFWSLHQWSTNC